MLDLDIARLAPEVAKILLLRAAESPTLQWQENRNLGAKRSLDSIEDPKLLNIATVVDEGMAAAVRALLYVWNGWIGEAKMYAQAAGEQERFHIIGFCERMQGNSKAAKEYFQKAGESPHYPKLQAYAMSIIGPGAAPDVHRFRKVLEMIEGWEPYAYCDLYAQAASGQLGTGGVLTVTNLQNREFELLFAYCYQKATGTDFSRKPAAKPGERKTEKKRPKAAGGRRASSATRRGSGSAKTGPGSAGQRGGPAGSPQVGGASAGTKLKVVCPGCRERLMFASSARGKKHKCPKCSAKFLIPSKEKTPPAVAAPQAANPLKGGVRIACPKCRSVISFPETMRGQRKDCPQCAATFIVPLRRSQAVAAR